MEHQEQRDQIIQAIARVSGSGILSLSGHGNMSVRVPGEELFLMTGGGTFVGTAPEELALIGLDGTVVAGGMHATGAEVIQMHAVVYRLRPDAGSVLHVHSPNATSFAVSSRDIPLFYEAQARHDILEGIPLARYAPRGSMESVDNIATVLGDHDLIRGLLLESHGQLAFGATPAAAAQHAIIIEETAQLARLAEGLGGPTLLTPEQAGAAVQRRDDFARRGAVKGS